MKVIGTPLFQWEVGRQLQIIPLQGMRVDLVHFSNPEDLMALSVEPKEVNGMIVADIPNKLLQSGSNIVAYSVNVSEDCVETLRECVFPVRKRAKPSDYVYTETEVLEYLTLSKRIDALEKNGGGGGNADLTGIINTASGNPIALDDSAEKPLELLKLYGKTTQNGTPSPDAPVPLVNAGDGGSIAVSVLGENMLYPELFEQGSLLANGSETNSTTRLRSRYVYVKPNQLYSLKADGLLLYELMEFDDTRSMLKLNSISAAEFTFTTAAGTKAIRLLLRHADNTSVTTVSDIAHIQMAAGSAVSGNLPYREPQTLTVPTPNGLPGIPVTSGGNYTDSTGQQWLCDEMDFDRGVYVQRVAKGTITEKDSNGIQTNYSTDNSLLVGFGSPFGKENGLANRACLSDRFATYHGNNPQSTTGFPGDVECIGFHISAVNSNYLYMRIFRNRLATQDNVGVKAWLADNNVSVLYQLATPIETPLSDLNLSVLHTHYPNTTVFNDAGAGMKVQYVADTKHYIDNKFNELATALVNNA